MAGPGQRWGVLAGQLLAVQLLGLRRWVELHRQMRRRAHPVLPQHLTDAVPTTTTCTRYNYKKHSILGITLR